MIQNEGLRYRARASERPRRAEPATIAQSRAAPHNHVYDRGTIVLQGASCSRVELCHKGVAKDWSKCIQINFQSDQFYRSFCKESCRTVPGRHKGAAKDWSNSRKTRAV